MTYRWTIAVTLVSALLSGCARETAVVAQQGSTGYDDLSKLFAEWRTFQAPRVTNGVPDYSAAAMGTQRAALATFQRRLDAIDPRGWPVAQQIDHRIVRAEMNGFDFDHRVLQPWVRDPAFYIVIHTSQSDVPEREGPGIVGAVEAWTYTMPVAANRLDDLRTRLKAVPGILQQARRNLTGNARDLWTGGIRAFKDQPQAFDAFATTLATHHPDLAADARDAGRAAAAFVTWLEAEKPKKTGPSGVGIDNYNWNLKHVHLLPYTWQEQAAIMRRELYRAHSALRLEEHHNRSRPPLTPVGSAEEHTKRFNDAVTEYMTFLEKEQVLTVAPYMDKALRERIGTFSGRQPREFFSEVDYRDPVVMRTHGYHWFDLARMAREPHASPIRRVPLLYNIWDARAEGLATGMEEMMMHAGLFDGHARARELIFVMLAQRAARALGDLMMHANQWSIDQAAQFAADWTPHGWLRLDGNTVWFEQHLYLQQPAYGTSYLIGKIEIEKLLAERAMQQGSAFTLRSFMDDFAAAGIIPVSLIRWQLTGRRDEVDAMETR